ncbi:glycoside hydrolase family 2 protein [Aliiglaciecola sp. CAU 1673]|uniref:beta-mannosidase n=1 Tax=Aliiglaciecola sp. CAU 1673 TaxID=3032595 RepID=UPI0023DB7D47|nr:glycoside hydrolase family 2 protein [Aliiglaciecola sp. CAU 1673]MDF2178601.1 glycoside hydrolase family 2 protein [Aliiglaciecola sp. CAU 1673]
MQKDYLQSLCGHWQFRQADQSQWLDAQVPGCNFTDLMDNGLIPDPFVGDNETKVQWVEQKDWCYRKAFVLDNALQDCAKVELVAQGLDTFCDIYLNGHKLGSSDNMFVGHRFDCKAWLKQGENQLEIHFRSPINEVRPLQQAAGLTYPAENDKSEDKLSVFCRKAPCHFGWDWGPRLVTSGIWRDIYLQGSQGARFEDIHYRLHHLDDTKADFEFALDIQALDDFKGMLQLDCTQAPELAQSLPVDLKKDSNKVRIPLRLNNPQKWWPNGLGKAFLYDFQFSLKRQGQTLDRQTQAVGLRTLEVINEPDAQGLSFYLKVNGVPVFMKGANYVPGDSLIHRMTPARLATQFEAVVAANMNMLRVWGGGVYQDDAFYRLADKHGILIWQDFMFACTLYPGDENFLANVRQEAEYNIKRLRNHACLALWCGNNEVEMGIKHWQWPQKFGYSPELYERLKDDYLCLFDQCLPGAVKSLDGGRFYLRSSPIGFWEEDSDHIGNHHFWGVWHGEQPFSEYQRRVPRFMSEFGFQSFPMPSSMARFSGREDHRLDSPVMTQHQKHPRGNGLIQRYLEADYHPPKDFDALLYLSQVQQAEGLRLAFEAHRTAMPFCMGSLYWQLNDTWPAASWSGIDYYGRWKALHYQAARSFAPQLLSVREEQEALLVWAVNDCLEAIPAELSMCLLDFAGDCHWSSRQDVTLAGNNSAVLTTLNRAELLSGGDARQLVLVVSLQDSQGRELCRNLHYFVPPKAQQLQRPKLDIGVQALDQELTVTLCSDTLVRHLYLEIPGVDANFNDNFFDLLPGEQKQVQLRLPGLDAGHIQALAASLQYQSLLDSFAQEALCS